MFRVRANEQLILASTSPRRRELLAACGLEFDVAASSHPETYECGELPEALAKRLAREKAELVAQLNGKAWVLGADTEVWLGEQVLGKPRDREHAVQMLCMLQGRPHAVWGGFALLNVERQVTFLHAETTTVTLRQMNQELVQAYVRTGEPMDKAGAYAAQGIGAALIERVEGSFSNVVGLNIGAVVEVLHRYGVIELV